MKDNKNDDLGSISFLDIDDSGKITKIEEDMPDKNLAEIEKEVHPQREYTKEMKEMVEGTYIEKQEQKRKEEAKREEKNKDNKAKMILFSIVLLLVAIYSVFSFTSIRQTIKERDINAKVTFLTNNATYANNVKTYFKDLSTNADKYYQNYLNESSTRNKASSISKSIENEIQTLTKRKEDFTKYEAESLYNLIYGRLTEAKNLATVQGLGGNATDMAYKTNEFIMNENNNSNKYESALKTYLTDNEIPFVEENGRLIYTVNED